MDLPTSSSPAITTYHHPDSRLPYYWEEYRSAHAIPRARFESPSLTSGQTLLPPIATYMLRCTLWHCVQVMPSTIMTTMFKNKLEVMQKLTLAVSFPIPVFAPVTMMTLPDKSGISSTLYFGLATKVCFASDNKELICEEVRKQVG
jgi:hypothetical protein